jgi:4-hydroxythreonine-4-phosphate dehydrogenase
MANSAMTGSTGSEPDPAPRPIIAITPGEPAGIGPDIVLQHALQRSPAVQVVIADPELLRARAAQLGLNISIDCVGESLPDQPAAPGRLWVLPEPLDAPCSAGQLDTANASYVLRCLDIAIAGCQLRRFSALVTGPVNKAVINDAGITFSGHTEYLAQQTDTAQVVMMLVSGSLRVALATTHLPLRAVSEALSPASLQGTLDILQRDLKDRFGLAQPRILVLGLNPHAGEGGHLGHEEIDIIEPVITHCRDQGYQLTGPVPADSAFTRPYLEQTDAVLAMYHDQGLPALKALGFGNAVNITLGLPIIRTSVDHGTALELAGTGRASQGSLQAAVHLATQLSAGAH